MNTLIFLKVVLFLCFGSIGIAQYYQNWISALNNCDILYIYKFYKLEFKLEQYLQYGINTYLLTKLRSGTLNLIVGRYNNSPRDILVCICCSMNRIETEYHFVLYCSAYISIGFHCLPKYYCSQAITRKLVLLLQTKPSSHARNFFNYLNSVWKIRSGIINSMCTVLCYLPSCHYMYYFVAIALCCFLQIQ